MSRTDSANLSSRPIDFRWSVIQATQGGLTDEQPLLALQGANGMAAPGRASAIAGFCHRPASPPSDRSSHLASMPCFMLRGTRGAAIVSICRALEWLLRGAALPCDSARRGRPRAQEPVQPTFLPTFSSRCRLSTSGKSAGKRPWAVVRFLKSLWPGKRPRKANCVSVLRKPPRLPRARAGYRVAPRQCSSSPQRGGSDGGSGPSPRPGSRCADAC